MRRDAPGVLDTARVRAALSATRFADVRSVAVTGSTNDDVAPHLGDPSWDGTTLVADLQTAGKGRKPGRAWISPAGSALLMTTVLPVPLRADALWAVPFWTALAVADGVEQACTVRLELRWPNDLDLRARKISGILCASRVAGDAARVACGVGLNLVRPSANVATEIVPPPAYLGDAASSVAREDVLAAILTAMDGLLPLLDRPDDVARAWEQRAELRGRDYAVKRDADGTVLRGRAVRLDGEGGLILDVDGTEHTVHLGDARVIV